MSPSTQKARFALLSLLSDYTPLRHESLQRLLLKPCLNLRITIGTVGGTTPQPQNHYWYFWFYSSTSESLLAMWQIIPQPQNRYWHCWHATASMGWEGEVSAAAAAHQSVSWNIKLQAKSRVTATIDVSSRQNLG
jgi:hypothetical protein